MRMTYKEMSADYFAYDKYKVLHWSEHGPAFLTAEYKDNKDGTFLVQVVPIDTNYPQYHADIDGNAIISLIKE